MADKCGLTGEFVRALIKEHVAEMSVGHFGLRNFFALLQDSANTKVTTGILEHAYVENGLKLKEVNQDLLSWIDSNRGKYAIGTLTNLTPARLLIDEKINVYSHFDFAFLSCKVGLKLEKIGIEAAEATFIDDNENFLAPAKKLGMNTILFTDNVSLFRVLK